MDQGPLVTEEIDAGAEFVRRFDRVEPVKVAFWLKEEDRAYRHLHIASERVDGRSLRDSYGEVVRLIGEMRSFYLDVFRVNLIDADDPLAKAAAALLERYPGPTPIRFAGRFFGGVSVEDFYLYPAPQPAAV